ncbi:MAG: NMD3-related protein [Candidatus Nanoarchaeia archaeon]|nr:NMD3-related protein [Candidatus Jingweiarchaeum tengchongense]
MEKEEKKDRNLREKICPKCGRSEKEVAFHGFICIDDFLAEKKMKIPSSILLQICRYEDKMNARNNPKTWVTSWREIMDQIANSIKVSGAEVKCSDVNLEKKVAVVDIIFEGDQKNRITKEIPLEIRHTLCDVHTKSVRGYYEAIIQIRPPENWKPESDEEEKEMEIKIKRKADRIISGLQAVQPEIYIKKESLKKGIDLYVSSTPSAFKALSMLGIKIIRSKKLWTMKEGKELYRTTFIVRIKE